MSSNPLPEKKIPATVMEISKGAVSSIDIYLPTTLPDDRTSGLYEHLQIRSTSAISVQMPWPRRLRDVPLRGLLCGSCADAD